MIVRKSVQLGLSEGKKPENLIPLFYRIWIKQRENLMVDLSPFCQQARKVLHDHEAPRTIRSIKTATSPRAHELVQQQVALMRDLGYSHLSVNQRPLSVEMQLLGARNISNVYMAYLNTVMEHVLALLVFEIGDPDRQMLDTSISTVGSAHAEAMMLITHMTSDTFAQVWNILLTSSLPCWRDGMKSMQAAHCVHGFGHGMLLWHTIHAPGSSFTFHACTSPHLYHASISMDITVLHRSIASCNSAPYVHMRPICAGGIFHYYFRYSLEFASAVSNIGDKIGFVREFCSSLRIEVISRVCLAQADALAGGQYILTGPVAFGNWIQLEQTLVEERTNNDLSNAIANLRPDFNHPDNDTIDNMNMMQKAEYLVETLGLGESAIKAAF